MEVETGREPAQQALRGLYTEAEMPNLEMKLFP